MSETETEKREREDLREVAHLPTHTMQEDANSPPLCSPDPCQGDVALVGSRKRL